MTATAHALIAGAIASRVPNPLLATVLAFTSHFIIDTVPHWDIGTNWRNRTKKTTGIFAIIDTAFGITLTYFLFSAKVEFLPLTAAIIASLLPDWAETPWYIFFATQSKREPGKNASIVEKLAYNIYKRENQFHTKTQFPLGFYTQVATVAFFLLLLK